MCPSTSPRRPARSRPLRFPGVLLAVVGSLAAAGCAGDPEPGDGDHPPEGPADLAVVGATLHDGTDAPSVFPATLLVRDGRVAVAGPAADVSVPEGTPVVDGDGRHLVPGLVNVHGHVGGVEGLRSSDELHTRDNLLRQLERYAHYGVTTVVSLGGDRPVGAQLRDEQDDPALVRSRLYIAGPVLNPGSPEEAEDAVAAVEYLSPDWVKIRVDDFLGQAEKMDRATYGAVIRAAADRDLPVAAHIVTLEDARGVVDAGAALLAHSVRDLPMDEALLGEMREREVCLTPTLTREVSTFVYRDRPDFFDDPFFLERADPAVLEELLDPERQAAVRESEAARAYEAGLRVAMENLARADAAGVGIGLGTDSGPPARFQGYFEHLEMEMMADAGLTPERVLRAAAGEAARCMGLEGVGTLVPGAWADFILVDGDPTADVRNLRRIHGVWIAGNRVR
jgi:imidazolonepropionase-like amidohydrolase